MNSLYKSIGVSKQAVFKYLQKQKIFTQKAKDLLVEAQELRKEHPGCGVEKMYYVLKPDFLGRDRFIELMMELGFRVQYKKNYKRTTYSISNKYSNLIKGYQVNQSSTIWQSDITYYSVGSKFYYAVFIIDVYSKVIVGHKVSDNMRATANVEALQMALSQYKAPKIHHSDRGSQYIYSEYIKILKDQGTSISMALSAQDNAYAERINKTIKEEYLDYWKPKSFKELIKRVDEAVQNYNHKRIHVHLNRTTPIKFYQLCQTKEFKRPVIEIHNNDSG
jgi:putative transposase